MKIALYPGSFDPITKGHESIIRKILNLFDLIYIAVGINSNKSGFFSLEQRFSFINYTFQNNKKIKIVNYEGLTVDFCNQINAKYIIRGIRNSTDFDYEKNIAYSNSMMNDDIETLFILPDPKFSFISSSIVRDIIICGGDASAFIPDGLKFL